MCMCTSKSVAKKLEVIILKTSLSPNYLIEINVRKLAKIEDKNKGKTCLPSFLFESNLIREGLFHNFDFNYFTFEG